MAKPTFSPEMGLMVCLLSACTQFLQVDPRLGTATTKFDKFSYPSAEALPYSASLAKDFVFLESCPQYSTGTSFASIDDAGLPSTCETQL
jgi:hypothetical protein